MTNGQQRLIDRLRAAEWDNPVGTESTRPGGSGADAYSPDLAWHIHVDGERDGTPNQYRVYRVDGQDRPARTFHARGKVPTPDQAAGAWENAAAAEATDQAAASSRNGRQG